MNHFIYGLLACIGVAACVWNIAYQHGQDHGEEVGACKVLLKITDDAANGTLPKPKYAFDKHLIDRCRSITK